MNICNELHNNFLEFAHEANSERAFPDVRDGLKPGQRACLWEMYNKGYTSNKPHVKSAKISGGTAASWWPHGTTAIYETFARMSQPWINNIPEVDWHGNNGNIVIGQSVGADRYTEAKLSPIVEEGMLQGLKKKNVPMILNFSEDEEWPAVFPSILPRLLVNGSQGIGVSLANYWAPMNFKEAGQAIIDYLKTGEIKNDYELFDFPSGGIIINKEELPKIHLTGKGRIVLRAKATIENNTIKITELPYQVYVEPLIDEIKTLIETENLDQIKDIYNKTDKNQLLIEIECYRSAPQVLNLLYSKTSLQTIISPNQWALDENKNPQLYTLGDYFEAYKAHNLECIKKEYEFDLEKAANRKNIVDGLLIALVDIDEVISIIKKSKSANDAVKELQTFYKLNEPQAQAIVDMKLGKLANLERLALEQENKELINNIDEYNTILNSEDKQIDILIQRLSNLIKKYGTPRKTELTQITITKEENEIAHVEPEKVVVVMTKSGNIKRIPATAFREQNRNTKGAKLQKDDITEAVIRTNTIDNLLLFTNKGKVYKLLVDNIPVGSNTSTGTNVNNLIEFEDNEEVSVIYSLYRESNAKYVLFVTTNGLMKKVPIEDFTGMRKRTGVQAIKFNEGDSLAAVSLLKDEEILIITEQSYIIRINSNFDYASRAAKGIKGINLGDGDKVITALPIREKTDALAVFNNKGLAKRIDLSELSLQNRGGKGVKINKTNILTNAATLVAENDSLLLNGTTNSICISAADIPLLSRTASGNTMIKDDVVIQITKI